MLGWELPPHHTGGMGIVCYQMCKQLARTGAQIEFVLPYTADFSHIDFMAINPALPDDVEEVIGNRAGSTYDSQHFEYVLSDGSTRGAAMNEHQAATVATRLSAKLSILGFTWPIKSLLSAKQPKTQLFENTV